MSSPPWKKAFAAKAEITTFRYRGPDRREENADSSDEEISRQVRFDAKGNPILDVRTNVTRRREDDDTIDLIECLDADKLDFQIDED